LIQSIPTLNWLAFPDRGEPAPVWPLREVLHGIAAAGSPGAGVDDRTVAAFLRQGETVDGVAALLGRLALRCTDVGILHVGDGDTAALADSLARLARTLGADTCIAAFAAPPSAPLLDELRRSADVLAGAGVRLALEFAPYGPVRTLAEAVSVCERVGWDRCGLLIDIWHVVRSGVRWHRLGALRADQIALVHLSDAPEPLGTDQRFESRFRRLPPGTGSFPTVQFLRTLERIGYEGVVSAEVLSSELRALPPAVGAGRLVESMRRLGLEAG
jgi:sugar phosphate isomerase/epimerase